MAGNSYAGTVYGKDGSILYNTGAGLWAGSMTISDVLGLSWNSSGEVTELSKTAGGTALNPSTTLDDLNMATIKLYDVTLGPGCHLEGDYSAMQGPAPDGFHVPLNTEWQAVKDIRTALGGGSSDGTNFGIALKLPFAGYRDYSSAAVGKQGSYGNYWSSSRSNTNLAYYLYLRSSTLDPRFSYNRAYGFSVRCFKNSPVIPTSSWTKLYGTSIESGGIFWSSTDGLISLSSDGTTWITIADKNLGATTVWNSGNTLSEANCGKYYQWGNNYGFPRTGTIANQSTTQVDASSYGPGNYYSSDTFIKYSGRWDTTDNGNLWGGETGVIYTEVCPTYRLHGCIGTWHMEWVPEEDYSAMQGPAPSGFHVPLITEWSDLRYILKSIFGLTENATTFGTYLKMPMAGIRDMNDSDPESIGSRANYWSSTGYTNDTNARVFTFTSSSSIGLGHARRAGISVRCFKDSPVVPTSSWTTLYNGSSVASGAGVFWNSTDGLISVSGNGTKWYTIMDKNLGATTVYNQGDTLTDANCGYFYQRGNNYGFPHSGTVTTSATPVDASNYGPGNYYNSSTFITRGPAFDWSSVLNNNLWGGVTGIIPGHYRPRQPVVLKTYEEIVAMANAEGLLYTNTLNELNTYPIDYYNMLNNGGYYGQNTAVPTNHIIGIEIIHDGDYYYIRYNNGTRSRGIY